MKTNLKKSINTLIQGDSIIELKKLPDNSIDLIFADPPYNLQLQNELYRPNQSKVAAVNDEWDKFASFEDYDAFTFLWLKECKRILKKTGSIWVIGSYHNIFRVGKIMQDLGLWILNDVVWIKTNPMPNFKGTRFNNAHETLVWASKDQSSKPTFHYKTLKFSNEEKQMRSDWYIPICSGKERIKVNGQKAHSTQKPEALLQRVILATSKQGDVVLDPFLGSGTTAAVAKKLGRNYIGIEKDEFYLRVARRRLDAIHQLPSEVLDYPTEIKPPKVPFLSLIENNYINAGGRLYSEDKKFQAKVLANGTLKSNDLNGSIHKVSAQLLGKENNNGWTFWYYKDQDRLISIDEIRSRFVKENY